jgi:hypothetical protein
VEEDNGQASAATRDESLAGNNSLTSREQIEERKDMPSKFYVVEKNGVPAVWQSDPKRIGRMLKHKPGFTSLPELPSGTRAEALVRLRQLFPGSRPPRAAKTEN